VTSAWTIQQYEYMYEEHSDECMDDRTWSAQHDQTNTSTCTRNIVTSTWTIQYNNYEDMDEEHSDEYMDDRILIRTKSKQKIWRCRYKRSPNQESPTNFLPGPTKRPIFIANNSFSWEYFYPKHLFFMMKTSIFIVKVHVFFQQNSTNTSINNAIISPKTSLFIVDNDVNYSPKQHQLKVQKMLIISENNTNYFPKPYYLLFNMVSIHDENSYN
jgi:hypothetical protein